MHQGYRAFVAQVLEVSVETGQLPGGELALVHDCFVAEAADVELVAGFPERVVNTVGGKFSQDVQLAFQVGRSEFRAGPDEYLLHARLGTVAGRPDLVGIVRVLAVGDDLEAQFVTVVLEHEAAALTELLLRGKEQLPDAILTEGRQFLSHLRQLPFKELVGDLRQNSRPIPAVGLASAGTPVLHIGEHGEGILDDGVGSYPPEISDEARTTGIGFQMGHIEAGVAWCGGLILHRKGRN